MNTKPSAIKTTTKPQITIALEVKKCRGEVKFDQKSSWVKPHKR